jgi:hypothetical protein
MKRKFEKITTFGLGLLMGGILFVTTTDAASLVKNLRATYNNIKVTYNGQTVTPSKEPFMVDGTVYVSLRDAGQITGNAVTWSNNTVHITGSQANTSDYAAEIINKNSTIAMLQVQLSQALQKIDSLEANKTQNNQQDVTLQLKEIVKSFERAYSGNLNIDWDIDFVERSSAVELTLTYSSSADQRRFNGASTSKVESFLKEICEEIVEVSGIKVQGEIVDYVNRKNVVAEFSYTTSGRLSYSKGRSSSSSSSIEDLEDDLYRSYRRSLPSFVTRGDVLYRDTITLDEVEITERRNGTVDVVLHVDFTSAQREDWNTQGVDNNYANTTAFLRLMRDIADDIAYELGVYEEDVYGYIYADDVKIVAYENDRISVSKR